MAPSAFASVAQSGISYQGRILRPDGTPLTSHSVQFKLQLRAPDAGRCLLYEEVQLIDMSRDNGMFALTINDGTGSRTPTLISVDGAAPAVVNLDRLLANLGSFSFDANDCATGSTYSPNASDGRTLVVYFKDETMSAFEPIPAVTVNYVPYAFQSKQIAGFGIQNLMRVQESDGSLSNISPLSKANYDALQLLLAGTSGMYERPGRINGAPITGSPAAGQVLSYNGSVWTAVDPVANVQAFAKSPLPACGANQFLKDNGSGALTCVTATTSGGTVTSVTAGTGLTTGVSPITTAGSIGLATVGTGGTGFKITYDTFGRVTGAVALVEADIPSLTSAGKVSGSAITSGTIAGSVSVDTTGYMKAPTGSFTALGTKSVQIFETTNSFKVNLEAPASLSSNYTLTLPATAGSAGNVLSTNGSGVLSWTTAPVSSQWVTSGSNISYTAGKVGIGIAATADTLSVSNPSGDASIAVMRASNTSQAYVGVNPAGAASDTNVHWSFGLMPNSNSLNIQSWNGTASTPRMTFTNSGEIGIGTSQPTGRLTILNRVVAPTKEVSSALQHTVVTGGTSSSVRGAYSGAFIADDTSTLANYTTSQLQGNAGEVYAGLKINDDGTSAATNWNGVANSLVGNDGYIANTTTGSGVVNNAVAVAAAVENPGSGVIRSSKGLSISKVEASGSDASNPHTAYGIYIDQVVASGGSSNKAYSIYSNTSAPSYYAGSIGVGVASPSASVHLKAGNSTVGSAPLKLTSSGSGVLLSTPEDGALEYDGTGLWFTVGTTRYVIGTNTTAGNYSNVSNINNSSGSISINPAAGNSVIVNQSTISTSPTTGALIVNGGAGVAGALNVGGSITAGGALTSTLGRIDLNAGGATRPPLTAAAVAGEVSASVDGSNDFGFMRLSAGGRATVGEKTYIDLMGYQLNSIVMGTSGQDRVTIAPSGKVGIGTSAPIDQLSIEGTGFVAAGVRSTTSGAFNEGAFALGRADQANGYAQVHLQTNRADVWNFGLRAGDDNLHFFGPSGASQDMMVLTNDGKVGIGSTAPATKFHMVSTNTAPYGATFEYPDNVNGTSYHRLGQDTGNPFIESQRWTGFSNKYNANRITTDSSGGLTISTTHAQNSGTGAAIGTQTFSPVMTVTGAGLVGIGTTSPTANVQISTGGAPTSGSLLKLDQPYASGASYDYARLSIGVGGQSHAVLTAGSSAGPGDNNPGFFQISTTDLNATPQPRLRIDQNGNVGIGTMTPTARLDVAGTVKATAFEGPMTSASASFGSGSTSAPSVSFAGDSNTGLFQPGADILGLVTNGIERARVEANGQFNILSGDLSVGGNTGDKIGFYTQDAFTSAQGTSTANYGMTRGPAGAGTVGLAGYNGLSFYTTATERMRITAGGNVGIGTTSPNYKIETVGDIGISGAVYTTRIDGNYSQTAPDGLTLYQAYNNVHPFITFWGGADSDKLRIATSAKNFAPTNDNTWDLGISTNRFRSLAVGSGSSSFSGSVGIGTAAPAAKLDVAGQIRPSMGTPVTDPTDQAIDFATGNTQYGTFTSCPATINLYSLLEGGSYSLILTLPAGCSPTFTGTSAAYGAGGGTAVTSFKYPGGIVNASTGQPSVYSFLRANNFVFAAQVTDFK